MGMKLTKTTTATASSVAHLIRKDSAWAKILPQPLIKPEEYIHIIGVNFGRIRLTSNARNVNNFY
jgi:hypothetical protein